MTTSKPERIWAQHTKPATDMAGRHTPGYSETGPRGGGAIHPHLQHPPPPQMGVPGTAPPSLTYDQSDLVWATIFTAGIAYEVWALYTKQYERTASQATRRWWRTHTPTGKATFTLTTTSAAVWYVGHILRWWR